MADRGWLQSSSCNLLLAGFLGGLIVLGLPTALAAQGAPQGPSVPPAQGPATSGAPAQSGPGDREAGGARRIGDPYEAYDQGVYDQALQGFVDQQVERPEDPAVAFNIGSSHYQMKDYEAAQRSFAAAALSADPKLQQQAVYNLGNVAFRQGKLEEAVEHYKRALELDPDDQDAKFNLEFVRDEIRRRHEENQKRQQEQQNQDPQNQDQQQQDGQDQQNQDQQNQDQQNQDQQGQDQQDQGQDGQDQQQDQGQQDQQGDQGQQGQQGQDSDNDGLPDEAERNAQNPTDPQNPDSDGDGLKDGQEDRNGNGQVDEGETDPNDPDSDDDGVSDGEEAQQQAAQNQQQPQEGSDGAQGGAAQAMEGSPEGMTPEEAERYLRALEEGQPDRSRDPRRGRRGRPEKDW
ncbi:MAG: tetratricopeptide repeat protein [Acidobacteriota bacterium]|nr:tetratricopeptide repeat protein [Acidobacteriota bacterium]